MDRGKLTARAGVALVVGLVVAALLTAVLVPVGVNQLNEDSSTTLNQTTSDTVEVTAKLNSTVTATTSGSDATVELNQTDGNLVSKTVNVGSTETFAMDRGDVNVTVTEAGSGYAVVEYEYRNDFGYSDGARGLWGVLDVIIILAVLLFIVGMGLNVKQRL